MKILIKNLYQIKKIKIAAEIVSKTLKMIENHIIPGVSTEHINKLCHNYILKKKANSASLGYYGFPKSICTSVNNVVCHGIPSKFEILKDGDIINVDVAVIKDNYYADGSKMFFVGTSKKLGKKLCKIAKNSLYLSIEKIKPGVPLSIIGSTIQKYVEKNNFSVVRKYCGHGIGLYFHEAPQILHYKSYPNNTILKPGMIFTIEPMINTGTYDVFQTQDGWTVKTEDNGLSAQYEHTILVTETGYEILT